MNKPADKANSKSMRLCLLGSCRVNIDGQTIEMRRKPKQLVKLLALQPNQRLHREQIVDVLWTDQESEAATNNLHKTIHAARRALEPDLVSGSDSKFILTKEGQVILNAPDGLWIDVLEFENLAADALKSNGDEKLCEAALALYAGDLLSEDLYEDWASERRENLRLTHRRLLQKLGKIYESEERFEQSATVYQKLVAADELDESAHRNLIKIYAFRENRSRALKQYEICRAVLKKELGVEPERETRELFEQITSGKFEGRIKQAGFPADSNGGKSSAT